MFADYVVESSEVTTGITRIGLSLAFYTVAFAVKIILQSGALDWIERDQSSSNACRWRGWQLALVLSTTFW